MDTLSDISHAARLMVDAFRKHGLQPPRAIVLDNVRDVYSIMFAAEQIKSPSIAVEINRPQVLDIGGRSYMSMEISGIIFYYPAQQNITEHEDIEKGITHDSLIGAINP